MYKYSKKNAKTYSKLGIKGTTYEVGFNEIRRILGTLKGKLVLDFGSGAGRSGEFLLSLGADKVIGVDHDQNMITQSKKIKSKKLDFIKINEKIPFDQDTFDIAMATSVFIEVESLAKMQKIINELYRVIKPKGILVIGTTNPKSIGQNYISYSYKKKRNLKSGDKIICTIKGENSFEIEDYYWTENDYKRILENAGFKISMFYPRASGHGWLDETKVAPGLIIKCVK